MKLYILSLGEACIDKGAVISPGVDDGKRVHIPIPAYLLRLDDGRNVLIDTGMHRKHIEDPEYTFRGTETGKVLLPVMRREDSLIRRLAELDLSPQDVEYGSTPTCTSTTAATTICSRTPRYSSSAGTTRSPGSTRTSRTSTSTSPA
jgi:hypothetical protein